MFFLEFQNLTACSTEFPKLIALQRGTLIRNQQLQTAPTMTVQVGNSVKGDFLRFQEIFIAIFIKMRA